MASLREEFEKKWADNTQNQRPSLRQQLDMSPEQRDAYKKYEWQEIKRVREQEEAENLNQMYSNYANQYNSYLDQIKSFDQNAGGTLRAGTGGYYHSPETYTNIEKQLGQLKQTGERLDVPWAMIDYTDPKGVSGLPSPTEITRYVADMTGLAESQRDYYGQYKSPGQYYNRPMVPEVTQREPEGPANPDWRQDYLKPDAKLPEDTRKSARNVMSNTDVKYTNWTQPQLSDDEQKAQLARGEEYSQYASGVPDNAKPAWQAPGVLGSSFYKPDAFMEREIAYKKWKDNENSPYKTPVYVDVLKSSGQWETMPTAQRITAMKLGYQDEAKKYGKQIDGLGLRDRDGRVAEITYTLDYESLTPEKQRALEEERAALLSGDLEEAYSDLEFRRAGAEKQAKKYETLEGWKKFDQKYQYVWNNADFVDLSGYDATKLKPGNQASQYYEYFNAGPERKLEIESATTKPVLSFSGFTSFMSPTVMESNIRLKGIDELDADEILVFNYLYNKKGADAAMEYLDGKGTELLSRRALTRQQRMEERTENGLELASLATLYWQMENALTGPVQFVAGMLGADPNDPIFDRQSDVATVRSKAGQVLDQVYGNAMIPILNVPVASTLYNAGMSAGDSLIGRALGAVVGYQGLNRLMMTSRVLGSEMQNSLKDGDSIGMAVFRGLSAAIIENVTESLGDKAFYGNPRSVALYLAQNFFAEGSEEFLATLGNTMVEFAAKGTESEIYQKALDAAHKRNWSRETAQSFAFKEWLREAGTDFLTGSLMGLMSSAAGAPGQQSRVNQEKTNEAYSAIMADEGIKYSNQDIANLYMGELLQGDTPTTIESVLNPTEARTEGYDRAEQATTPYTQAQSQRDIALSRLGKPTQSDVGAQLANAAELDQAAKPVEQVPDQAPETGTADDRRTEPESQGIAAESVEQFRQELESVDPESPDALERIAEIQNRMDMAGIKRAEEAQIPYHGRNISYKRENIPDIQEHRAKNPDLNDEAFDFAAETAYGAGLAGSRAAFEAAAAIKDLAPETAQALFEAGIDAYSKNEARRNRLKSDMAALMPKPGQGKLNISKEVIAKMNQEQKNLAKDLQQFMIMVGVEGDLFAGEQADESGRILSEEGSFDPTTGRFRFDINAGINFIGQLANKSRGAVEFALPRVMGHEFTHYLKATAPELYTVFQEAVVKELSAKNQLDDLILTELGRARKGALSIGVALEEVVARSSEMMFRDSQALARTMGENPTLWQKFKAWVTEFAQNIKDRMKGMNPAYAGAKSLIETGDSITRYVGDLQAKWDKALEQSITDRMDAPGLRKTAPISPVAEGEGVTLSPQEMGTEGAGIAGNDDGQQERFSERSAEEIQDMVEEVVSVGGLTDADGNLVLYHRTSKEAADKILSTGRMTAKEDGLFFSTKPSGYNDGYGDTVVKLNIPASMLELDDIFKDEAHLRLPLQNKRNIDVSEFIKEPKFSERDSDNAPLSPEQIEYFKDSKVRDEQGRLLKVYHGTPYGGFTIFRDESYFTGNKEYADIYQNPSASSVRGRYDAADNPMTYEVYLNITRPFDTRNATEKRIFTNQFYRKYGNGTPLSERGLPDWTDSTDLIEFIQENGLDYDGIILDEGGTGGYGEEVKPRGLSYVPLEPEQAKSTTNLTPTTDPDIRYSVRDPEYLAAVESGDMDTAQKLVDEAAKAAGYTVRAYHGTKNIFTVFDKEKIGSETDPGWFGEGFYFHVDKDTASIYSGFNGRVVDAYLKLGKTWDVNKLAEAENKTIGDVIDDAIGKDPYPAWGHRDPRSERETAMLITKYLNENGYDSVRVWGQVMVINPEQIKLADPVTYDDAGSVIPLSRRFDTGKTDIRYAQRDPENSLPSARAILGGAFGEVAQTDAEKKRVAEYRKSADRYNRLENELNNLLDRRKQLYRDKAPQSEKNELRADINALRDKLDKADRVLLNLQMSKPLRDVVTREVDKEYQRQKAKSQERQKEYREKVTQRDSRSKFIKSIEKGLNDLRKRLLTPDKKHYVPESLRKTINDLLQASDMAWTKADGTEVTSRRSKSWQEAMGNLMTQMQNADAFAINHGEIASPDFVMDIDPDLASDIQDLIRRYDSVVRYRDMDPEGLAAFDSIVKRVRHAVTGANNLHDLEVKAAVSDVAEGTLSDQQEKKDKKLHGPGIERLASFLNLDMADAFSFFERLGPRSRIILDSLYKRGFGKLVRNTEQAREFFQNLDKKYKDFGIANWSGKNAQVHTFDIQGGTVHLTTGQVMELYLLNKREQARGHIYGKGLSIEQIKSRKAGKAAKLWQKNPVRVIENDVNTILGVLTNEQRAAADEIAGFLNTVSSQWGNEVSMTLYGYLKFVDPNYYPIHSDTNFTLAQDPSKNEMINALLNLGSTKNVIKGANNPVIISDIFDTVTRHITDMANYNAFAVPLSNAMKWFNYKRESVDEKGNPRMASVRGSIERTMGKDANRYFINLLKSVNGIKGTSVSTGFIGIINSAVGKFKTAAVAGNIRVVLQQHASYARAASMINPAFMAAAYAKSPKRGMQMARKYSPIAMWKHLGYYDMQIGREMTDLISGRDNPLRKVQEVTLKPAGLADDFTLGVLWNAIEIELGQTYEGDKRTEEFYKLVGDRLTDVIDRTQVVDTVFHRPQIMRDRDSLVKISTSFMAEPIKGYNMLVNAARSGDVGRIARTGVTFVATSILTAMAAGLSDALRDKEKEKGEEGFWDSYWSKVAGINGNFFESNIFDNINPLNMIPLGKDIWGIAGGYTPSRPDLQAVQRLIKAGQGWLKVFDGTAGQVSAKLITNTISALSTATGIPASNIYRDVMSVIDTLNPRIIVGEGGVPAKLMYERYASALLAGDEDKALEYYNALIESGTKLSTVHTGIRAAIKANFEAGKINRETYIQQMIDATDYDDIKNNIIKQWFTAGEIDEAEAKRLLLKFTDDDEAKEQFRTLERWKHVPENDEDSYRILNKFLDAVRTGKNLRAVVTEYTDPNKYAYDSKYLAGQITDAFKQEYIDNPAQRSRLKGYLLNAYTLLGYDREKKSGDIDRWLMKYDSADFENAIATGVNLKAVIDEKIKYSTAKNPKGVIISQVTATFADQYKKMTPTERAKIKPRLIDAYVMLGYDRAYSSKKIDKWLTD